MNGINRGPVADSSRRKNKIHGPEEVKADSDIKADINLKNQNVKLPNANKWDDTQPGGGNYKPKLSLKESLEKNKTQCIIARTISIPQRFYEHTTQYI